MVLASMPTYFWSLDLPKYIVNGPIQGRGFENPEDTQTFMKLTLSAPSWLPISGSVELFSGFELTRLQMLFAFAVIWIAQALGVIAESLKIVAFDSGAAGADAAARIGLQPNAIALAYQFGYLIPPAVVPVALWIGLNRDFIEALIRPDGEPVSQYRGQNTR